MGNNVKAFEFIEGKYEANILYRTSNGTGYGYGKMIVDGLNPKKICLHAKMVSEFLMATPAQLIFSSEKEEVLSS